MVPSIAQARTKRREALDTAWKSRATTIVHCIRGAAISKKIGRGRAGWGLSDQARRPLHPPRLAGSARAFVFH